MSSRLVTQSAIVAVGLVLISAAFLRGSFLLGVEYGIICVLITIGLLWLFLRTFKRGEKASLVRVVAIVIFSVPIGFAMAFPASIDSDVQFSIDQQTTDRAARAELTRVFSNDPAFAGLSISIEHLKVVNVTISGELPRHADLERLRGRIANECPTLLHCTLQWSVTLHDTQQKFDGLDRDLFVADG